MSLFTGMAILEEHFATAYFRFNDDAVNDLRHDLRAADGQQEFVERWGGHGAESGANRCHEIAGDLQQNAAGQAARAAPAENTNLLGRLPDRFFHARLQGIKLGVFDVLFDSLAAEQVEAGQAKAAEDGALYYDVWTSFSPNAPAERGQERRRCIGARKSQPTGGLDCSSTVHDSDRGAASEANSRTSPVELNVKEGGTRDLVFELSRFLKIESVKLNGQPVEFIHNPAVEGTQLSRRGNDIVAVILPEPAQAGQKIELEFVYGGEVLAEAGNGLLYVGARGTWYPNRGMAMADFDLEFEYPQGWTLVATGTPTTFFSQERLRIAPDNPRHAMYRIDRFRWRDSTWENTKWQRRGQVTSQWKPMRR